MDCKILVFVLVKLLKNYQFKIISLKHIVYCCIVLSPKTDDKNTNCTIINCKDREAIVFNLKETLKKV